MRFSLTLLLLLPFEVLQVLEAGMAERYGAALDHSLEVRLPGGRRLRILLPPTAAAVLRSSAVENPLCACFATCLFPMQALFSLTRYFGNPKAEAAKRRLWEPQVNLPSELLCNRAWFSLACCTCRRPQKGSYSRQCGMLARPTSTTSAGCTQPPSLLALPLGPPQPS